MKPSSELCQYFGPWNTVYWRWFGTPPWENVVGDFHRDRMAYLASRDFREPASELVFNIPHERYEVAAQIGFLEHKLSQLRERYRKLRKGDSSPNE